MCITTIQAALLDTIVGVWDIQHPEWGYRHVLAYQNKPKNLEDSPNCMLLHIPSKTPLEPKHILPTDQDPNFLEKMVDSFFAAFHRNARGRNFEAAHRNHLVEMGIYHIALLNSLAEADVAETLKQVPEDKRPAIAPNFLDFYREHFPGFPLVLCCFNNQEAKKASPIMLHFDPIYPDTFMFPLLDGHGSLPEIGSKHHLHQMIVTGSSHLTKDGNGFHYFDLKGISEELRSFVPQVGAALDITGPGKNTDLLLDAVSVRAGGDADLSFGILGKSHIVA